MSRFNGKTALVTGASAGIGKEISQHLLAEGARVISVSRRELEIESDKVTSLCVDLADPEAVKACADHLRASEQVDILVNNAGVVRNTMLGKITDDEFDMLNNLHVRAAITLSQAVLPNMKAKGFGRIVNMSSRAVVGLQQRTVYAATKAAMIAMTRTWALELGPLGITVNAIAPGPVVTDMLTTDIPEESDKAKSLAASLPTRRLGKAEDVARATLFFADPDNGWVTGQTLFVCGGASLGSLTSI
ncbi:SDR family oxidoreductase [uncultured Shimia sp.]|uniref:SDR family NAD(P)-dependent oxidoreductase n=1 Tax=uncultured Shimia sp. TaxID=573152 RepID=UPI002602750A|nr:SDR family oxidoreductase [uncultured Shimia sp.]